MQQEVSLKPKPKWRGAAAAVLVLGVGGLFVWKGGLARKLVAEDPARLQPAGDPSKRFHVYVKSEPMGADIFIDGELVGATPLTLPIDLNGKTAVRMILRKDGYDEYEQRVINETPISINMKAKFVDPPPAPAPAPEAPPALPEAPPAAAPPAPAEKSPSRAHHHGPISRRSRSTPVAPAAPTAAPAPEEPEPQ
jgi:hypothetical protein